MSSTPGHPYFPTSLILPNFVPNEQNLSHVLISFIGMWITTLVSAWYVSTWFSPTLGVKDKSIILWFVLCGTLHVFFEGYFVLNRSTFGGKQTLFAQLWKEYVLSDSRYISGDLTVLCAEAITMVAWGPLSYLTAVLILISSPYRHSLQAMVSLGHLYGDVLYLSTSIVDLYARGVSYSRPEPYYFWFYFLFLNLIWVFVPTVLLYQSIAATSEAFQGWEKVRKLYQEDSMGNRSRTQDASEQ